MGVVDELYNLEQEKVKLSQWLTRILGVDATATTSQRMMENFQLVRADVREFVQQVTADGFESAAAGKAKILTGCSVAKVLYGVPSTQFPSQKWRTSPFWGKYTSLPFWELVKMVSLALPKRGTDQDSS